jgi:exopolysaccharide biosynthesis polyprenyl glycosylphosphotransferase
MAVAQHLLPELRFGDGAFYALVMILVLVVGTRVYGSVRHLRGATERLLIVGTSPLARLVIEEIARHPNRYVLVGVVEDGLDLDRLIAARRPSRIVVAFADRRGRLPLSRLVESRARGIRVEDVVETYESLTGKLALELMPPSRVIFSHEFATARVQPVFARALSLIVAIGGLIVLAPLMALIALAIKLDSRGPVFYADRRIGVGEREFPMLKFRTMVANAAELQPELEESNEASGALFKIRDDPRVTRVGRVLRRLSLDELPQLWNVLRGQMSLVGPRPLPLRDHAMLEDWHRARSLVLPGMTGLWQISGRSGLDFDDLVRLDFAYIEAWSIWLDISIIARTIPAVLSGRGAY